MGLGKSKQKVQGAGPTSNIDTEIRDSDNVKFKGMKPLSDDKENKKEKGTKAVSDQSLLGWFIETCDIYN